jgi:DNA repair photolyase
MSTLNLFDQPERTSKIGQSSIVFKDSASILTEANGFMTGYDFTLNPYGGCTFGCTYCYAAFFSRSEEKMTNWGYWVEVKQNAVTLLKKKRGKLYNKVIYMSSVTDPYQPIEKDVQLSHEILKELALQRVKLVIQTRSHLVVNDLSILKEFDFVQVNMTITTDSEKIRKSFEPMCPSNKMRLEAIRKLTEAGIPTCITMTPLLPIENVDSFIADLLATGVKNFIVQPFHKEKGKFVRGTREEAMNLLREFNWSDERYKAIVARFKSELPNCGEGQSGFAPPF